MTELKDEQHGHQTLQEPIEGNQGVRDEVKSNFFFFTIQYLFSISWYLCQFDSGIGRDELSILEELRAALEHFVELHTQEKSLLAPKSTQCEPLPTASSGPKSQQMVTSLPPKRRWKLMWDFDKSFGEVPHTRECTAGRREPL